MSKYLTAKQFCEIVLDRKRKLPKEINILKRKKKAITRIFGWFETIRSCNHYNHFKIVTAKSSACEKIEAGGFRRVDGERCQAPAADA